MSEHIRIHYPGESDDHFVHKDTRTTEAPDQMLQAPFVFARVEALSGVGTHAAVRYARAGGWTGEATIPTFPMNHWPDGSWVLIEQEGSKGARVGLWRLARVGKW